MPLLAKVTPFIGHFQIRNRGTVGGSIAHADPAAEYPAVALALDARIEVASPTRHPHDRGRRLLQRDLDDDDGARRAARRVCGFPVWERPSGFGVEEFARRHGDFAVAGAIVGVELDADDRIARCGIALIGLGSVPRAAAVEAEITGRPIADVDPDEIGRRATAALDSTRPTITRLGRLPQPRRRGDGGPGVVAGGDGGGAWLRSRCT